MERRTPTGDIELDPEAIVAIESLKSMASESEDWGSYIRYLQDGNRRYRR